MQSWLQTDTGGNKSGQLDKSKVAVINNNLNWLHNPCLINVPWGRQIRRWGDLKIQHLLVVQVSSYCFMSDKELLRWKFGVALCKSWDLQAEKGQRFQFGRHLFAKAEICKLKQLRDTFNAYAEAWDPTLRKTLVQCWCSCTHCNSAIALVHWFNDTVTVVLEHWYTGTAVMQKYGNDFTENHNYVSGKQCLPMQIN